MGLSLGAAIILGAALAPTDPVLAGDVGVGPPGDEDEHEPNFALTAEAGLNDGLAFPFVFLGAFVAAEGGSDWLTEWLAADVLYAVLVGTALGGRGRLRDRREHRAPARAAAHDRTRSTAGSRSPRCCSSTGWPRSPAPTAFSPPSPAGVAFRNYEHGHEMNGSVHHGAEVVEKFCELGLILLLGSLITVTGLGEVGAAGWLLVAGPAVRHPPAGDGARVRRLAGLRRASASFIGWFGVRGIGSLYYVAVALGLGILSVDESRSLFWTVAACIVASIVVHGVTATPLSRRLLDEPPS